MALTIKNLGSGTLLTTVGVILAGSTTKSTLVKSISLVNTHASLAVTVNVWLAVARGEVQATTRLVSPVNVSIPAGAQVVLDNEITLASTPAGSTLVAVADKLIASASLSNFVDYVINGLERDL